MINDYLIYILLAITVTAIPGPAVVLTIKNSIKHGYKVAIVNVVGNFIAMIILAILSAIGLGAVIITSSTLFSILRIVGCLYLVYLGIIVWKAPLEKTPPYSDKKLTYRRDLIPVFKEGFIVGITNPKAIAFFVALFPQFIDPTRSYIPQFLTLILTIEGISFMVLSVYALLASYASVYLAKDKSMEIFNKLTGVAFVGFGLALLREK